MTSASSALSFRLRFWLWLMSCCEDAGLSDTPLYFWLVRRAAASHRWRKP